MAALYLGVFVKSARLFGQLTGIRQRTIIEQPCKNKEMGR
jgi:hypothetical protein